MYVSKMDFECWAAFLIFSIIFLLHYTNCVFLSHSKVMLKKIKLQYWLENWHLLILGSFLLGLFPVWQLFFFGSLKSGHLFTVNCGHSGIGLSLEKEHLIVDWSLAIFPQGLQVFFTGYIATDKYARPEVSPSPDSYRKCYFWSRGNYWV